MWRDKFLIFYETSLWPVLHVHVLRIAFIKLVINESIKFLLGQYITINFE